LEKILGFWDFFISLPAFLIDERLLMIDNLFVFLGW